MLFVVSAKYYWNKIMKGGIGSARNTH